MKRIIFILTLFLMMLNPVFADNSTIVQNLSVQAQDGFNIKAVLEYPKDKTITNFKTIVLLHSLGYNSQWWENLPEEFLEKGYAVLKIDLRGHGKSIYNSKLTKTSWASMTNKAYAKYPDDVISVINYIQEENRKKIFFNDWAIVGSDIGASTAILAAEQLSFKPKTIVMLSPGVNIKGLYIPVKLADLNDIDIFSISGENDITGQKAEAYLKKFAQSNFATYISESKSNGMMLLKNDTSLARIIVSWVEQYL